MLREVGVESLADIRYLDEVRDSPRDSLYSSRSMQRNAGSGPETPADASTAVWMCAGHHQAPSAGRGVQALPPQLRALAHGHVVSLHPAGAARYCLPAAQAHAEFRRLGNPIQFPDLYANRMRSYPAIRPGTDAAARPRRPPLIGAHGWLLLLRRSWLASSPPFPPLLGPSCHTRL